MSRTLPLLPLRDIVLFPHMVVPLFVGRDRSIHALEEAMAGDRELVLVAQRRARQNDPGEADLFPVGTIGTVLQLLRLPDGTVKVLVEGRRRARLLGCGDDGRALHAEVEPLVESGAASAETAALVRTVLESFEDLVRQSKRIPPELLVAVQAIEELGRLADTIAAHLTLKVPDRQALLELADPAARLERLVLAIRAEIEILQVEKKIRTRVKRQIDRSQKEYYLNEQMQAIQKELGERDEFKSELAELDEKVRSTRLSTEALQRVKKEIRKLKMMAPMSAEATVVRGYIDWILSLPWGERSAEKIDVAEAERILEEDHHGLEKVKERILEYIAVQALVGKLKGPILCLVGPPGVGKTSLARSIARATGRRFVRLSLGGVRDEAEIRGHRRTYIGALPGKIIQHLKKAGTSNPVFLLDEVDKMSTDFRGDPSAALLEVLDPEQNATFCDHYLDLDFDLSDVLFVTTANSLHAIPAPLQDRMEVIQLPGYTEWEKLEIARRYLIPKQREQNGLTKVDVDINDEAIRSIVQHYTKEAGVRGLERELATVCRKIAREHVGRKGKEATYKVTPKNLVKYLDVPRFHTAKKEAENGVGLANGLAVTAAGGDLLATEVTVMPGRGKLVLTGKLGEVMQESAQAAMSYVRARAESLGLDRDFYQRVDLHIHLPEGAIPKDGPSAGITMAVGLASALLRAPVRQDLAMTGEITLRGRVLPVGGIKEKILAAHRSEIYEVIIPSENEKDLKEIPARVLKVMTIHKVDHADQVLRLALAGAVMPEVMQVVDWRSGVGRDEDDDDEESASARPM